MTLMISINPNNYNFTSLTYIIHPFIEDVFKKWFEEYLTNYFSSKMDFIGAEIDFSVFIFKRGRKFRASNLHGYLLILVRL